LDCYWDSTPTDVEIETGPESGLLNRRAAQLNHIGGLCGSVAAGK